MTTTKSTTSEKEQERGKKMCAFNSVKGWRPRLLVSLHQRPAVILAVNKSIDSHL